MTEAKTVATQEVFLVYSDGDGGALVTWKSDTVVTGWEFRRVLTRAAERLQETNAGFRDFHAAHGYGYNVGDLMAEGGPELLAELAKDGIESFDVEHYPGERTWVFDEVLLREPEEEEEDGAE
jgi:hypothetical protein